MCLYKDMQYADIFNVRTMQSGISHCILAAMAPVRRTLQCKEVYFDDQVREVTVWGMQSSITPVCSMT